MVIVKGNSGFTLVEVMVAVAILSFGILAVAAMQKAASGRATVMSGSNKA